MVSFIEVSSDVIIACCNNYHSQQPIRCLQAAGRSVAEIIARRPFFWRRKTLAEAQNQVDKGGLSTVDKMVECALTHKVTQLKLLAMAAETGKVILSADDIWILEYK